HIVLVGTKGAGLFISRDAGDSWTSCAQVSLGQGATVTSITTTPDDQVILTDARKQVLIGDPSTDHWQEVAFPESFDGALLVRILDGEVLVASPSGGLYSLDCSGAGATLNPLGWFEGLIDAVDLTSNGTCWYLGMGRKGLAVSKNRGAQWHTLDLGY
ncbi:unnamed protein product, partial [Chrysoparadoxa australica]